MTIQKIILGIGVVAVIGLGWRYGKPRITDWLDQQSKNNLPPAEQIAQSFVTTKLNLNDNSPLAQEIANTSSPVANNNTSATIPAEKNLAVPFTTQAPHVNWDEDHEEFCEEASILMVGRYFQGKTIAGPDDAEAALQRIKKWELDNLGYYFDTTAAETAKVAEGVYDVKVDVVTNPTITAIKKAISANKLVIVPAAGRELGNPNFTPPGPIYHMLVIRGYTKNGKFITNDPGTRRGEQYVYDQDVVMSAIHDWVPTTPRTTARSGSVATGRKVMLVLEAK